MRCRCTGTPPLKLQSVIACLHLLMQSLGDNEKRDVQELPNSGFGAPGEKPEDSFGCLSETVACLTLDVVDSSLYRPPSGSVPVQEHGWTIPGTLVATPNGNGVVQAEEHLSQIPATSSARGDAAVVDFGYDYSSTQPCRVSPPLQSSAMWCT